MSYKFSSLIPLFCLVAVGCALKTIAPEPAAKAPTFEMLVAHKLGQNIPLTGSYQEGAEIFKKANPEEEASIVFKNMGPQFIYSCRYSCEPPLATYEDTIRVWKNKKYGRVIIPGGGDVIYKERRPYLDAERQFANKFDVRMLQLVDEKEKAK